MCTMYSTVYQCISIYCISVYNYIQLYNILYIVCIIHTWSIITDEYIYSFINEEKSNNSTMSKMEDRELIIINISIIIYLKCVFIHIYIYVSINTNHCMYVHRHMYVHYIDEEVMMK